MWNEKAKEAIKSNSHFLRCMLTCHDCSIVEQKGGKKFTTGSSLDEICILDQVKHSGQAHFVDRSANGIEIQHYGHRDVAMEDSF